MYQEKRVIADAPQLATFPCKEVEASDQEKFHRYPGVPISEILALVEAPLGANLRGQAHALAVRAQASDGYVSVFALAEFNAALRSQPIPLVDQEDGKPLSPSAGLCGRSIRRKMGPSADRP